MGKAARLLSGPRATAAILVAVVLAVFAGSLRNRFTYDERLVIVQADDFLRAPTWGAFFSPQYFDRSLEGTYRPLVTLTYIADRALGDHPAIFKAQSLLWHALAAVLVAALARLLVPAQPLAPLVAGLFFALHPVTTEVVDNASFREDALATCFGTACLSLLLTRRRALALLAYALALLAKESAVAVPVLLLLVWHLGPAERAPRSRERWRTLAALAGITAAYLWVRFGVFATRGTYASYAGGSFAATMLAMPSVVGHYLRLMVAPWPLVADYAGFFEFGARPWHLRVWQALPVLGALMVLALLAKRERSVVALGIAWFFVALGPVLNVVPTPVPAAERFLYLPLVGMALAVGAGATTLASRPSARRLLVPVGLAVAALAIVTVNARHRVWHDDEALWTATADANPRSCRAHTALGVTFFNRALETGSRQLLEEAEARQERALSLCPATSTPWLAARIMARLGAVRFHLGNPRAARELFERSADVAPGYALPQAWLAYLELMEGREEEAVRVLQHVVTNSGAKEPEVQAVLARIAGSS